MTRGKLIGGRCGSRCAPTPAPIAARLPSDGFWLCHGKSLRPIPIHGPVLFVRVALTFQACCTSMPRLRGQHYFIIISTKTCLKARCQGCGLREDVKRTLGVL